MALTNAPKIVRGAFIEFDLVLPPYFVVFQFNPVELTRSRSISYGPDIRNASATPPAESEDPNMEKSGDRRRANGLREFHLRNNSLSYIQENQQVTIQPETISFELRLDATDKLEAGDPLAAQFGVLPQLATLELMVQPRNEGLFGAALGNLLGSISDKFSFTKKDNPPLILFAWGAKRVLPVNITSMNIKETEFNTRLDPIRATVTVNLTVIEGGNLVHMYSKVAKEVSAAINYENVTDIANVVVPG